MTKRSKIIHYLFMVLLFLIFLSVTLLDKNVENAYPNTVKYSAGGYFVIAAAVLCVALLSVSKISKDLKFHDIKKKSYIISFAIIGILFTCFTIAISIWAPEQLHADFYACQQKAIDLANGGTFKDNQYFITYKNNVNITVLFSVIYNMFKSWRAVIIIGALCAEASAFVSSQIVLKTVHNYAASLATFVIAGGMLLLERRTYVPYTDNFGMIFCVLLIYLFVSGININAKIPLMFLVFMAGKWIKPTVAIVFIAIIIFLFLYDDVKTIKTRVHNVNFKAVVPILVVILVACLLINNGILKKFEYETNESTYGATHWFLIGADGTNCGTVKGSLYGPASKEIDEKYQNAKDRSREYIKLSMQWYKERGLLGNIKFMMEKLDAAYNDGKFCDSLKYDNTLVEHNLMFDIFDKEGKYYPLLAEYLQLMWFFIISCLIWGTFRKGLCTNIRKNENPDFDVQVLKIFSLFELIILGVTAYILIFENRSKYLYMFLPVYIIFAILHFYKGAEI